MTAFDSLNSHVFLFVLSVKAKDRLGDANYDGYKHKIAGLPRPTYVGLSKMPVSLKKTFTLLLYRRLLSLKKFKAI